MAPAVFERKVLVQSLPRERSLRVQQNGRRPIERFVRECAQNLRGELSMVGEKVSRAPDFDVQAGEHGRLPSKSESYFGWGTMRR
jgi:hypothetical protein